MSESPFDKSSTPSDSDQADESIQDAAAFDMPDLHDIPEPFEATPVQLPPDEPPETIAPSTGAPSSEDRQNDSVEPLPNVPAVPIVEPQQDTTQPVEALPDVPGSGDDKEVPMDAILVLPDVPPAATLDPMQDEYILPARIPAPPLPTTPASVPPVINTPQSDTNVAEYQSPLPDKMPLGQAFGFWSTCGIVLAGFIVAQAIGSIPTSFWATTNTFDIRTRFMEIQSDGYLFATTHICSMITWALFILAFSVGRSIEYGDDQDGKAEGSYKEYLGFKKVSLTSMMVWAILVPGFLIACEYAIVTYVLQKPPSGSSFVQKIFNDPTSIPYVLIALLVTAPICEEIIFRGFLFRGIKNSPVGTAGAIIVTSVLFAIIHFQSLVSGYKSNNVNWL